MLTTAGFARSFAWGRPTTLACDPYFGNVSLLLHMDGVSGATTFPDSSPNTKTVSRAGNTVVNTTIFKYGTGSAFFDGSGDYLSVPYSLDLSFNSSNFTIEGWANYSSLIGNFGTLVDFRGSGTVNSSWVIFIDTVSRTLAIYDGPTNSTVLYTDANVIPTSNIWFHWAIVRDNITTTLYVNGVLSGSVASGTYNPPATSATGIRIGINQAAASTYYGYIDDLRITKGVARYTSNFTPPQAAFPDIDCGFTTFVDLTINNYPVEPIPTAWTLATDLIPSYPVAPIPTAWTLATDLIPSYPVAPIPTAWTLATDLVQTYPVAASSTVVKNFMGEYPSTIGVTLGSDTVLYTNNVSTVPVTLGSDTVLYTNNISTIPVTLGPEDPEPATDPSWANVSLLLHLDEAAGGTSTVDVSSSPKAVTFAGTSSLASVNTRDTTNNLSVATNGYISVAQGAGLITATGDFTIELWFNTSLAAQGTLFYIAGASSPTSVLFNRLHVYIGASSTVVFYTESSARITSGATAFNINTWNHAALTRASGVYRLFINGGLIGSYTRTTSVSSTVNPLEIGGFSGGAAGDYMSGWIDEVRVTNGVARYTAAFIPRLQPYPNS